MVCNYEIIENDTVFKGIFFSRKSIINPLKIQIIIEFLFIFD
jgi:hypothetical protein